VTWWEHGNVKSFTMAVIKSYMAQTGRSVFTYRDLRIHYYRNFADHSFDWHSVERAVRRLAQEGKLVRLRAGRTVLFGLSDAGMSAAEGVVA